MLVLEQVEREGLIVEVRQYVAAPLDEGIERTHRTRELEIFAARDAVENGLPRFVQAAAGAGQFADALIAAQGRLHRPLARYVAAQAQGCEQFETVEIVAGAFGIAGKCGPTDAIAAGA